MIVCIPSDSRVVPKVKYGKSNEEFEPVLPGGIFLDIIKTALKEGCSETPPAGVGKLWLVVGARRGSRNVGS